MMKFCPYCGASLADGVVSFCMECGKKIPVSGALPETNSSAGQQAGIPEKSEGDRSKKAEKKARPRKASGPNRWQMKKKAQRKKGNGKTGTVPPGTGHAEDGYDGYYDDVLPPDLERERDGIDKELVKKIGILAGAVFLVVTLCVLMMLLL